MPDFGIFRGFNEKLFGDKLYAGQLPINLGLIGSEDFGFDPDALAFFDRVTTAGGSLSLTEKSAIDTLVRQMKLDGIWTKMKAIYPMVGGGTGTTAQRQGACAQNLKSSSFTGTFSSGWTFASTGITPNGASAYMDTALNTSTNLTKTTAHMSLYVRNNVNNGQPYDLANAGNSGMTLDPTYIQTMYNNNNSYFGFADPIYATSLASLDSRGFWNVATNGSSTQTVYRNGTLWTTGIGTSGNLANNNLYLGSANANGNAAFFSDKQYAFCTIGDGLSNTNMANFYTAVQAFQTTLSRQVQ